MLESPAFMRGECQTDIFSEILKGINQRVAIRASTYRNALGWYR
jgi:hypothetical protein